MARFINNTVAATDLKAFCARYEGGGTRNQRLHPAMMVKGWTRSVLGFRQFRMRGLHRVRAEWKLVGMALNPRRMPMMAGCNEAAVVNFCRASP